MARSSQANLFTVQNTVVVTNESDLPPVNGSNQHPLATDTFYLIDGQVTIANNILIPADGNCSIGNWSTVNQLIYTGGGTLFVQSSLGANAFSLWGCDFQGNGTGQLFDLADGGAGAEIFFVDVNFTDWSDLGDCNVASFSGTFSSIIGYQTGFDFTISSDFFMDSTIYFPDAPGSTNSITLNMGADTIAQIINNTPFMDVGENFTNITTTANDFRMVVANNLIAPGGGELFNSSGIDSTDPRMTANGNTGFADSDTFGSFLWSKNSTDTTISLQGRSGSITAIADAGGGLVTATTSASHNLTNGESVSISGNSGYDGYPTISNVTATTFDFTATFVATGTGDFTSGWTKLGGTTFAAENERASMTGNNQLTFTNLDPVEGIGHISLTILRGAGSATPTFGFAIFKNSAPLLEGGREVTAQADTNSTIPRSVNLMPPLMIEEDDVFEVYGRNLTNTSNILIQDGQVTVN